MAIIGTVPDVEVGSHFPNRQALHDADMHRGLMRGIAPAGSSIVLSGGFVDDEDDGDEIIYTGEGGRDPNTGRQIADQTLTGGNLALAENYVEGLPVRVVRGHNLDSDFAPSEGYRYDGLYRIDSYWKEKGQDGFVIYRYRLNRLGSQPLLRATTDEALLRESSPQPQGNRTPGRVQVTTTRIIRSTAIGNEIKRLYDSTCQVCGKRLNTPAGAYAECCHIRPLGKPHSGPDTLENVLCLCANCHVLFDKHALKINDDLTIAGTGNALRTVEGHNIGRAHLAYHRSLANA